MQTTEQTHVSHDQRVLPARSTARPVGVAKVKPAEPPTPESFAAYLIDVMDKAGINAAVLSRMTAESHPDEPVDSSTISNLRTGKAQPGLKVIRKIAAHLGRSVGEMLLAADPTLTAEELGMVAEPLPEEIAAMRDRYKSLTTAKARRAFLNHARRSLVLFDEIYDEVQNAPQEPRMRRR